MNYKLLFLFIFLPFFLKSQNSAYGWAFGISYESNWKFKSPEKPLLDIMNGTHKMNDEFFNTGISGIKEAFTKGQKPDQFRTDYYTGPRHGLRGFANYRLDDTKLKFLKSPWLSFQGEFQVMFEKNYFSYHAEDDYNYKTTFQNWKFAGGVGIVIYPFCTAKYYWLRGIKVGLFSNFEINAFKKIVFNSSMPEDDMRMSEDLEEQLILKNDLPLSGFFGIEINRFFLELRYNHGLQNAFNILNKPFELGANAVTRRNFMTINIGAYL